MHGSRDNYQKDLLSLDNELKEMTEMVITAVTNAFTSYKELNRTLAREVIDKDILIDQKRWMLEDHCVSLIATQQPVASDLREIISVLNIIVELERIADYASGIAELTIRHGDNPHIKPLIDLPRMYEQSINMISGGIKAFLTRDVVTAKQTWWLDKEINGLYGQIFRELITYMIENPRIITLATYTMWVAHKLERIGDRAQNICERTVYLVKGHMEKMN